MNKSVKSLTGPVEEALTMAKQAVEVLQYRLENIMEENENLKKDTFKVVSEELRRENDELRHNLKLSYGRFSSDLELERFEEFCKRHEHDRATSKINSGKAPYVIANGCGVGVCVKAVCPICGEKKDITDTSVW